MSEKTLIVRRRQPGIGLIWKRYWRMRGRLWHCFDRQGRTYLSLCGLYQLTHSGGQSSNRPEPAKRYGRCDYLEMRGVGAEESLPPHGT